MYVSVRPLFITGRLRRRGLYVIHKPPQTNPNQTSQKRRIALQGPLMCDSFISVARLILQVNASDWQHKSEGRAGKGQRTPFDSGPNLTDLWVGNLAFHPSQAQRSFGHLGEICQLLLHPRKQPCAALCSIASMTMFYLVASRYLRIVQSKTLS